MAFPSDIKSSCAWYTKSKYPLKPVLYIKVPARFARTDPWSTDSMRGSMAIASCFSSSKNIFHNG